MKNKSAIEVVASCAGFLLAMLFNKLAMIKEWGIYSTYTPHKVWFLFQDGMCIIGATMLVIAILYVTSRTGD